MVGMACDSAPPVGCPWEAQGFTAADAKNSSESFRRYADMDDYLDKWNPKTRKERCDDVVAKKEKETAKEQAARGSGAGPTTNVTATALRFVEHLKMQHLKMLG